MSKRGLRAGAVLLVLGVGLGIQIHFLRSHPQPILFGDPGAYYVTGQKLQQAVARVAAGEDVGVAFESIRGLLYFAGVGSLYGLIDSARPQDIPYFRTVLSVFNTLAMLGVFFLARRLSGFSGGLVALTLAAFYPPFSVQTGRLFPDPITACLFVWSAYFYLRGVQDESRLAMFTAGLSLTAALFVRSQLFNYVLVLLVATIAVTAPWWWRERAKLVGSLVLGVAPLTVLWLGIVGVVGDDLEDIEAFGNFTFRQHYPYGFWQFLDSDGWMGPYRLRQEPYYRAMEARAENEPELLESYPRQLAFTLDYVASRASESVLLLLDNVYRLYDRPANDYKWDYPFAYSLQVLYQKLLVLAALAFLAVVASRRAAETLVLFIPACLAILHALSYPWPRFNQPAMPILIAAAGAFVVWAARHRPERMRSLLVVATVASVLFAGGTLLRMPAPEIARVLRSLATLMGVGLPFLYVALAGKARRRRILSAATFVAVALPTTAHDVRSPAWHETSERLGEARQSIALSREALARLRAASEAYVVLDLHVPDGNPSGIHVLVNGRDLSAELEPTMPRFGESTVAGSRNRREYRQWWAVLVPDDLLPTSAPATLDVEVRAPEGSDVTLYGDRFRDQERVYEGPSFGDWPHLAQVKLEYDGDYRLPVRLPLQSAGTDSGRPGVHRIRAITLASNEGRLRWESEPAAAGEPTAIAFYAYTGRRGSAELLVEDVVVARFPLGSEDDFDIDGLCYRSEEPRGDMAYGGYVLVVEPDADGPVPLTVRFRSGMSVEPMFVSLDLRRKDVSELVARCTDEDLAIRGLGRIVEAKTNSYPADTGRWRVDDVF